MSWKRMQFAACCLGLLLAGPAAAQNFFTEVPLSPSVGLASGDYNNDQWPDLFLSGTNQSREVLLDNQGNGHFADRTALIEPAPFPDNLRSSGVIFGDYDNDHDLDLYLPQGLGFVHNRNRLLRNDRGKFTDVTLEAGLSDSLTSNSAIWLDYDRDGWLDLYVGHWLFGQDAPDLHNSLYRNQGNGTFADVTAAAGLKLNLYPPSDSLRMGGSDGGMSAGDFDDDGWPDLYLGVFDAPNRLFLNDGAGHFTDATTQEIGDEGQAGGVAVGDIDNDGDLDIFQAAGGTAGRFRSLMLLNLGQGQFIDVTEGVGLSALGAQQTWGADLADIDNDGDLDLLTGTPTMLFLNQGDGTFIDATPRSGLEHFGLSLVFLDFDRDGFLDVMSGRGGPTAAFLSKEIYRNKGNDNHWLQVELVGTRSNRGGIGARLIATSADLRQMREVLGGNGHDQSEMGAHFGLGERSQVDRLEIRWPSGHVDVLTDIPADQEVRVFEGQAEYHAVQPLVWETPPPQALVVGADTQIEARCRVGLFEPKARITRAVADLRPVGGPAEVPLQDRGDGTYELKHQVVVAGPHGIKTISVQIEQSTPLGPYWSQVSREITVFPVDEPLFADGLAGDWHLAESHGVEIEPHATEEVYEGSFALGLKADIFSLTYKLEHPLAAVGYSALRFAFHPGEARVQGPQEGASRIAFDSDRDGNGEIYVMEADGSNLVNLTNHPARDASPAWSPDGQKIAFSSNRDGNGAVYVMDADGSNPINLTNSNLSEDDFPSWSPDGRKIAFLSASEDWEIYVMEVDGSNPVNLTNHPAGDFAPSWSPDGKKIAFRSDRDGNGEIYVMDADGTNLFNLSTDRAGDGNPKWLPTVAPAPIPVGFGVAINNNLVPLLGGELRGVDMEQKAWQVVEVPLEEVGSFGPEISSIRFVGNLEGTFYLDDIRLVSAASTVPSTAVEEDRTTSLPQTFSLSQNFPNPFNSETVIRFALPASAEVELAVYNLAGQQVVKLVEGAREAGAYTVRWDGRDDGGRELASGVYLYRLRAGAQGETRKLVLLR